MGYLTRNQFGAFCSACGEGPLSIEEDDWECCDACGGEGLGGDDRDELDMADDAAFDDWMERGRD